MATGGFQRFLKELRRRKVFRVAALYVAGAFGVLEAADILQGAMRLPGGFLPSVTVLVVLGFPLALAVGWKFDVTSSGVKRTAAAGDAAAPPAGWPVLSLAVVALLAFGAAGWTVRGMGGEAAGSGSEARADFSSIAVLPFVNLGGSDDGEYFADGLAEELANVLSRIEGLRVAARTSSFAFKGKQLGAKEIGDTLGVGMILEGSVRRAGQRVRVGAQLVRTDDGLSIWSSSWDRELTTANVFAIQDEITGAIASELQRELAPEARGLAERRTDDLEAYDLYLLGRHSWAARTADGLAEAVEFFRRALERDSTFALAWAGLADAWEARPFFDRSVPMAAAERVARPAARRALELAPDLAESQAAVGVILSDYDYAYPEAVERLERAVALNPNHAQAWSWLCVAHAMAGDPAAGLAACDRAVDLDPLSPVPRVQRALPLMALDRHEDALAALQRGDALGPLAWTLKVATLRELGRLEEVDGELVRIGDALGLEDPSAMRRVGAVMRGEPTPASALAVLRDLEAAGRIGFLELAPLYAWIGERDEAMRVFENAVARRDPWLPFAAHVTSFDPLRDVTGFEAALDSLGIM